MMKDLTGRVAVVTGGASGMGRAFAERFAQAGMSVVVADIEDGARAEAVQALTGGGAPAIGVRTDVADPASMTDLAQATIDAFGPADLVCLNAGVSGGGSVYGSTLADWQWTLGVNLYGVIHGMQAFVPSMVERDEGHVVVTASIAGHTSYPGMGPYNVSKHGAVTIAETLHNELREQGSEVGVTCLCPGFIPTNIMSSARNRPEDLSDPLADVTFTAEQLAQREAMIQAVEEQGVRPSAVADMVHDAVLGDRFWVFTDDAHAEAIAHRQAQIRARQNPTILDHISGFLFR